MKINLFPQKMSLGFNFASTKRTQYKNSSTKKEYTRPYYSMYEDYISFAKGDNPDYSCVSITNSNYTEFFRDDINDWLLFAKKISDEFSEAKKVNVYNFGVSDGSEAYTLIMSLIETLGEKEAEKFFPIKATDKDGFIVKKAKSGKIFCTKNDFETINKNIAYKFDKYFEIVSSKKNGNKILAPKEILTKKVEFAQGDIVKGLSGVEPSNSLILMRNFLRYLKTDELKEMIIQLKKLEESSRIVIGDFDCTGCENRAPWFLKLCGFEDNRSHILRPNKNCPSILNDDEIKEGEYISY